VKRWIFDDQPPYRSHGPVRAVVEGLLDAFIAAMFTFALVIAVILLSGCFSEEMGLAAGTESSSEGGSGEGGSGAGASATSTSAGTTDSGEATSTSESSGDVGTSSSGDADGTSDSTSAFASSESGALATTGSPEISDCCYDHPTAGCDDPEIEYAVCQVFPACCSSPPWGFMCSNQAINTGLC
jgi:hypothetical protein